MFTTTYRKINAAMATLDIDDVDRFQSLVQSSQPPDKASLIQRIVVYYRVVAPFMTYISGLAIWPAKWRAGLTAFVQALDLLSTLTPPDSAPVTASAVDDMSTTTDPTTVPITDPGFKAGKDL